MIGFLVLESVAVPLDGLHATGPEIVKLEVFALLGKDDESVLIIVDDIHNFLDDFGTWSKCTFGGVILI